MIRLAIRIVVALSVLSLAIGLMHGSVVAVGCGVVGLVGAAKARRDSR